MAMREHVRFVICLAALGGSWAENASCEAWGYGAENLLNCYGSIGGMEANPNHACWAELTSRPTCCGYCGPWAGSADGSSWVSTCNDLDIIRVTPGCSFELETAGGQRFTFHEDTRVCGNTVGCDSVRRIRVFGNGQPTAASPTSFVVRPSSLELSPRHRPAPPLSRLRRYPLPPPLSPAPTPGDDCPSACTARRSPPRP